MLIFVLASAHNIIVNIQLSLFIVMALVCGFRKFDNWFHLIQAKNSVELIHT